jgi:hypothetical protein
VLQVKAESDVGLERVEVRGRNGVPIVTLTARPDFPIEGFTVETVPTSPATLLSAHSEGLYDLRARALGGNPVLGTAVLSHQLLREPVLLFPFEGALDVPTSGLQVSWVPDPGAIAYQVGLEQDDADGLTVELPAGTSSFLVPEGILAPATETHVEIGAVAPSGNITLVEASFTTR